LPSAHVPYCHDDSIAQSNAGPEGALARRFVLIFDCNGVLVDSEPIAAAVAADQFARIGIPITPELVSRYFFGRRPADMSPSSRRLPTASCLRISAPMSRPRH
jgi:hypothetical protein